MAEKTITIKKDTIWKIATAVFAVLFIVSLFTGGFGITGHAVANGENTILDCASEYGLDEDTIIFYYSDYCGWCTKMKPGVQSLIDRGYDVYLLSGAEPLLTECVSNFLTSTGVPQFICVKTGEIKIGAGGFLDAEGNLDQDAMDSWFDSCLAG